MKTAKMLTVLVLLVTMTSIGKATPMGTGWTYQGRLMDANSAADGIYDFQFKLFDDANTVTGNQLGSMIDVNDVDVIDGYFTVELDFGSTILTGDARWLQIGVRPGEQEYSNTYTSLFPRQQVMPTPYALQTRGIFVDDLGKVGIGTANPSAHLDVYDAYSDAVINVQGQDDGKSYYKLHDGCAYFMYDEVEPEVRLWNAVTGGNAGPISFGTSNLCRMTIGRDGNVGIGTTLPSAKLDIAGNVAVNGHEIIDNSGRWVGSSPVPAGAIIMYGGSVAPEGWILCDGRQLSRSNYAELFAAIGTNYGIGDGYTTFNVPNLQQRFPLGKSTSGTGSSLGESGGEIDHFHWFALTAANLPAHSHSFSGATDSAGQHSHQYPDDGHDTENDWVVRLGGLDMAPDNLLDVTRTTEESGEHQHSFSGQTDSTGQGQAGTTGSQNPPYLVVNYIMKR